MAQPDLTSHHVNYLIWRYLQEAGHGDAAVSLQRAWYPNPQTLPFAPYVKTHALVSLVQKGLQYHEMEASLDKEGNHINISPSDYFFGPEPFEAGSTEGHDEAIGTDADSPAQVEHDRPVNGHAEPDRDETDSDESMEDKARTESQPESPRRLDDDGDISMAEEIPEPTLGNGHISGVSIAPAKPIDLTPNTALLDVENHVTSALWHPRDPNIVVGAGELFCSIWKLSTSSDPLQKKILDLKVGSTSVSTVAWDAIGEQLAVATCTDDRGTITMYNVNGDAVDLLPEVPRLVTGLHWAEDSPRLVVVASNHNVSELALWDDTQRPDVFPPPQTIEDQINEVAWCGRNLVFAAGDSTIYQSEVDNSIRLVKTFRSPSDDARWGLIRCIQTESHSVAVAASEDARAIWIPTHDIFIPNAHDASITGLDIRPQSLAQRIDFASFSADGKAKVWRVDLDLKDYTCIHQLSLDPSSPALAGSFSPDGYALGAFSKDRLFIWNVERGGAPISTWTAPIPEVKKEEGARLTNGHHVSNGHIDSDLSRPFSWDMDGKRLVCGFDKQVHPLFTVSID
ncbi:LisH dimerization motif subgroup [Penicillium bovifimosum]|uniref:LisH dimerization motif subgroup n=1 Tax=Penicillium bovifimosum TaxID=126998 RepID=A0A9W9L5N8_9EURO|nr:LisH dimerization motif subgroup [Penicillium bovifimosum]KAJ5138554.1 LisH dimerization motif subgroup [Penicillium bovifimosum]